jgi:hypothetical protein
MNKQYSFTFPEIQFDGEAVSLRLDEILGMIFKHIRYMVEKQHNVKALECVVTVPSHWTYPLKRLIADAVEIGGMKIL